MKTVVKATNVIRCGNKSLYHRKFRAFSKEMDATCWDLLLHFEVRWLSAGKCLERFFTLRNKISVFLSDYVKSDTSTLEEQFRDREFLTELAFVKDVTGHLNDFNMKLQGKDQTLPSLFASVNGFRNKFSLFKTCL
jgi:hypothetical protein